MKRLKKGFTLAETMIVLIVLGIIATLTIPGLVNKNKESVAKTKLRKAMATYESALNKMIIENDLKDNGPLATWAGNAEDNCANSTQYFKKVQGDGCIFKTSDGVWWNISDIERPLIAFKQDDLTTEKANAANDYSAFVLVGRFDNNGSLRVDDLAYETSHDEDNSKAQVEKLYSLLGMKKSSSSGKTSPFAACKAQNAEICTVNGVEYTLIELVYCHWDEDFYEKICDPTKAEKHYISIGSPENYNEQAHDYEGSTCQWCQDEDLGDYYNAAKRHCESSGGEMASGRDIDALARLGKLPEDSWFWTEEWDSDNAFAMGSGGDDDTDNVGKAEPYQAICIGKE